MTDDYLLEAAAARIADLQALGGMGDDELDYLAHVHEIWDPLTDGVECNSPVIDRDAGGPASAAQPYVDES
jgi:hypothetical protein